MPQRLEIPEEPTFFRVFLSPFRAIFFILFRPRLFLLCLCPSVLNILLFIFFVILGMNLLSRPIYDAIMGMGDSRVISFSASFAWILVTTGIMIVGGFLAVLFLAPVSAPFMDKLGERIELEYFRGFPELKATPTTFREGVFHSIKEALRRISIAGPAALFFFMFAFIPFIGKLISLTLTFTNAVIFLPVDSYSTALDRRNLTLAQKLKFLKAHKKEWLPLGLGLALILFIPTAFVWYPSLATVSGTRLYCEIMIREQNLTHKSAKLA